MGKNGGTATCLATVSVTDCQGARRPSSLGTGYGKRSVLDHLLAARRARKLSTAGVRVLVHAGQLDSGEEAKAAESWAGADFL